MQGFNTGIVVVAGSALLLGLLSKPLKRFGLPDSITLLVLGIAVGPQGFALLDPSAWGDQMAILEQVARLALAIGLMGVALRLPKNYVFKHWRYLALVLCLGMPFMWLCGAAIVTAFFSFSLGTALLIGAIITPTDPVVASVIVTGPVAEENLSGNLRHAISAEAGANDGLAYLFVLFGVFILTLTSGESLTSHILWVLVADILVAVLLGVLFGYIVGLALRKAEERDLIETPSILMITTALALVTLAGVNLVGSDGILAVFVAGLAFDQQVDVKNRRQEARVVEGVDRFFTSPVFILLGMLLPLREWLSLGWPALAAAMAVLLIRRLPLFLLFDRRVATLPELNDRVFAGWFGPIGVAALYYVSLAQHKTQLTELWPVVSLIVVVSIIAHGLTAMPFSHAYHRWQARR